MRDSRQTAEEYRDWLIGCLHKYGHDELISLICPYGEDEMVHDELSILSGRVKMSDEDGERLNKAFHSLFGD